VTLFDQPWPIRRFDTLDSTNEEARRRAATDDAGPLWITARRQTAGRGRQGRSWASPEGNLFATACLPFDEPLEEAARVSFVAGLALADAVEAAGAPQGTVRLKWPNDALVGEAKLAGILVETISGAGMLRLAIGFGLNVAEAPEAPGRPVIRLRDLPGCAEATAERVLDQLDLAFRSRLARWRRDGFEPVRKDWLTRAAHLGREVETRTNSGVIAGRVCDLDPDGALVVVSAGERIRIRAGDVTLVG
jgi:BirA family transcriptional regulator, biotin operon repressor / biotin---[acetyl-CoA-carboxylase] ligase